MARLPYMDLAMTKWAYDAWCSGYTKQEIADALDVSIRTVQRHLEGKQKIRRVLRHEKVNKITPEVMEWIMDAWGRGYTQKEISEAIGVPYETVNYHLKYKMRIKKELIY